MKKEISKDYKLAAKLTFVSAFIGFISFFMDTEMEKNTLSFSVLFFTVVITIVSGIIILNNGRWIRYVFLLFLIIGALGIFLDPLYYFSGENPMLLIICLLSFILQIYILILLFRKPDVSKS